MNHHVTNSQVKRIKVQPETVYFLSSQLIQCCTIDGEFYPPNYLSHNIWKYDSKLEKYVVAKPKSSSLGDFEFINSGVQYNAYYHQPSGLVFKIPNDYNSDNKYEHISSTEKKYNNVIHHLNIPGVRYAETIFIQHQLGDNNIPIIVQEFLDPKQYNHYTMSKSLEHQLKNKFSLKDLHKGNVLQDNKTGEIVLIDCL